MAATLCPAAAALAGAAISWTRGPDTPLPRGGYYAAWHDGGLLIAGGTYWQGGKKYWTDKVNVYRPDLDKWLERGPLPRPLAYGALAGVAGGLYLLGGVDEAGALNFDVYRLDGQEWVKAGRAPVGFVYATATVVGSRVYIFGGGPSITDLTTATNQAWSFEPATGQWVRLKPVPGPHRLVHAAAALGRSVYLFGGLSQKAGEPYYNLDDAHRFDTESGEWQGLKRMPVAARALWAAGVGRGVYLFGGSGERALDTVYRYDAAGDEYRLVSRLPAALMDTKFLYHRGTFYGATGEDRPASRFAGLLVGRLTGDDD